MKLEPVYLGLLSLIEALLGDNITSNQNEALRSARKAPCASSCVDKVASKVLMSDYSVKNVCDNLAMIKKDSTPCTMKCGVDQSVNTVLWRASEFACIKIKFSEFENPTWAEAVEILQRSN